MMLYFLLGCCKNQSVLWVCIEVFTFWDTFIGRCSEAQISRYDDVVEEVHVYDVYTKRDKTKPAADVTKKKSVSHSQSDRTTRELARTGNAHAPHPADCALPHGNNILIYK